MKKIIAVFSFLLLSHQSFATTKDAEIALDKVSFQTSAKSWVSTQTALVRTNINATLSNTDLVKLRADILTKLNKIAKGDWHITQFDRSQDNSGLEKLFVNAEARIPQSTLTDIYKVAKEVSQPGAQYSISGIDFTPSLEEVTEVKGKIRDILYQQINAEITRLNKAYPTQNYSVNRIYVMDGDVAEPKAQMREMKVMMMNVATNTSNLAVSNELTLTAVVELASNRKNQGSESVVKP